jgi:hypothetical protein
MNCGHNLCPNCFKISASYNSGNLINSIFNHSANLKCLICDKTQNNISKNTICDFLSKSVIPNDIICAKHQLKITKYCRDCNLGMCSNCNSIHNDLSLNHVIVDFNNHCVICDCEGKKISNIYCQKCNTFICKDCYFINHQNHYFNTFDEVLKQYEKSLDTKVKETDKLILNLNEKENEAEVYMTSVNDKFNDLIERLQAVKKNLIKIYQNFQ